PPPWRPDRTRPGAGLSARYALWSRSGAGNRPRPSTSVSRAPPPIRRAIPPGAAVAPRGDSGPCVALLHRKEVLAEELHDLPVDVRKHRAIEAGRVVEQVADEAGQPGRQGREHRAMP